MAQTSRFWITSGTGDGPGGGYTAQQFYDFLRKMFSTDQQATQGVVKNLDNELIVTGAGSPLTVGTGAALVHGIFYENTSAVTVTVTTPSVGLTGGHVALRVDWAAQTVRAVAVRNTDGIAAIPALVQSSGTTWEIRLASFTISTAGTITLTDTRAFLHFGTKVDSSMMDDLAISTAMMQDNSVVSVKIADGAVVAGKLADGAVDTTARLANLIVTGAKIASDAVDDTKIGDRVISILGRSGSSPTSWGSGGSVNYTPGPSRIQVGIRSTTFSAAQQEASFTVTLPVAFSNTFIVIPGIASVMAGRIVIGIMAVALSSSQFTMTITLDAAVPSGGTVVYSWIAIGPE